MTGDQIRFELVLRYPPAGQAAIREESERLLAGGARQPREATAVSRAADPADIETVRSVVERAGLSVEHVDAASRRVTIAGTTDAVNRFFNITLVTRAESSGSWRGYDGTLKIPPPLEGVVEAVLGLSTKPVAAPR
jgi:kumamolisin